ncbi:hypothetical protein [Mycobacterium paraterrae]|uniref:Uncharacterized protein n=1 Tax=Mycobacterium paraterrae TaxID=577492 RepID=A0ABY3VFH6_9MYCO|nr:hypothetical protein [Mycobacterium paraterrae]UMB68174.1 hypothetical protein MKK62_17195 [Mycobacterium paraterrae]
MSRHEKPDDDTETQPATENDTGDDGSANPPTYPAYSTPPAEGLPDAEHR